jgi:hypothetical protein
MLFALARHEVAAAETAAQEQRPYRSPHRWSLQNLAWATFLPDEPARPWLARALVRFNPSRAILGLEARGFVLRDRGIRHLNLALTRQGFAEARRLGGVPESEIVDLDRVTENWLATIILGPDPVPSSEVWRAIYGGIDPGSY